VHRLIHTAQALVDEVAEVPNLPARGQNVMATAVTRYAASAVNILVAAARSGATAVHAGAVGTGPNADLIRETLAAEHVAIVSPPVEDLDTGICFVMVEPSAERTFVTTLGAERHISLESLMTSQPAAGDLVCVSGYSLVGSTRDPLLAFLEALPEGVEVVLDPGAIFAGLPAPVRDRMLAVVTDAWEKTESGEAVLVSHQMPIVMVARSVKDLRLPHDPRQRRCALSSITTLKRQGGAFVEVDYQEPAGELLKTAIDLGAV